MKRILTVLITTLILLGTLTACGGEEPISSTPASSEPTQNTPASGLPGETTTTSATTSTTTTATRTKAPSSTADSVTTTTTTATTAPQSNYNPKPAAAQTLTNTKYLLTQKKAFNIAYYGGSITQGTGASKEEENSWRALTTAWLKSAYPDAAITEIEAARGGTGTYFGKMRTDFELLNYNPDLVFIEFVVNDQLERKTIEQSKENLELIIRKCYQKNPNMDIVLVYTRTVALGSSNKHIDAFNDVAKHYGLSTINIGAALEKAGGSLTDYFTDDKVHPNDAGYKVMANEAIAQMKALLSKAGDASKLAAHPNPQPLKKNLSLGVKAYTADDIIAQNPSLKKQSPNDYCSYESAVLSNGDTITVTFKGTSVGVWWRCFDRAAILTAKLDGKAIVTKTLNNTTHYTYELFENLENTTHTFTFTYNGNTALYLPFIFVTN